MIVIVNNEQGPVEFVKRPTRRLASKDSAGLSVSGKCRFKALSLTGNFGESVCVFTRALEKR